MAPFQAAGSAGIRPPTHHPTPPKLHLQNFARGPTGRTHTAPPPPQFPPPPTHTPPPAAGSSCRSPRRWTARPARSSSAAVFTFLPSPRSNPRAGLPPGSPLGYSSLFFFFFLFGLFFFFWRAVIHSSMRRESTDGNARHPTPTRGRGCVCSCPRRAMEGNSKGRQPTFSSKEGGGGGGGGGGGDSFPLENK